MSGFDNDVVYADNIDFSGGSPVSGKITADGQIIIGRTSLNAGGTHIDVNTITGGSGITVTNGPGTITISGTGGGGTGLTTIAGNSGNAPNIAGVTNVIGSTGLTTTGDNVQTLTITPTGNLLALSNLAGTGYVIQTGVNTFVERSLVAGTGVTLTNGSGVAGATTIAASTAVPILFTEDSGTATPSSNNLNILGTSAQGISTAGSGASVTITASNSSSSQKGVSKFDNTNFTVTSGNVTSNALTVTAGTGLSGGGSVNLGGTTTVSLDVPVTVAHGGTGDTSLTAHGVLVGEGTSAVAVTTAGTNGQALLGATGADPAFATIGGTQGVTLTTGANSLSIGLVAVPNSALANSSIIMNGGSGISVSGSPVSLGGTVTISASGATTTQVTADSGTATPSLNNLNFLGTSAQGISSTASGSTVTYTAADATTTTKGVAKFNPANFSVSSGLVSLTSTSAVETLTPDVGGAVSPTGNNVNILGYDNGSFSLMDTHNVGSSTIKVENRTWLTSLVVDPSASVGSRGTFATITDALAAASSGQDIFIRPGTYTEDLTLVAGVNLTAFSGDGLTPQVTILGNATFTGTGTVTISNIQLQTNSASFLTVSGSSASVVNLESCYLNCANATGITYSSSSASSGVNIYFCLGTCGATGTLYNYSGAAPLLFIFSSNIIGGLTTTASNTSGPVVRVDTSRLQFPISTSSTGSYDLRNSIINVGSQNTTGLTTAGTGTSTAVSTRFLSGTASAISIGSGTQLNFQNGSITSSNTNEITGLGTLKYTPYASSVSGNINVSTQTPQPFGPRIAFNAGPQMLAGSGSPAGSITATQGSLFLRSDGTTINNRAYINTNGGTGWAALTTAS